MSLWEKVFGRAHDNDPQLGEVPKMMTMPQLEKALGKLMSTGLDSAQVMAGLGVECPNCGPYTKEAKTLLVICAIGPFSRTKGHFFADPKMAASASAFENGRCPKCGGQEFGVTFSSNPRQKYFDAYYRLPQDRRSGLEIEFQQKQMMFRAKAALDVAVGGKNSPDPTIYMEKMIDFISANMPARAELSEEEFFGLAHHVLDDQASAVASRRKPAISPKPTPPQVAQATSSPALTQDTGDFNSATPSWNFADFPLNPQNLFRQGCLLKGVALLNIATIGQCICAAFEAWRGEAAPQRRWPEYADRELVALKRAYERMHAREPVGIRHSVDTIEVQRLAKAYIERVKKDDVVYAKFMNGDQTLYNLSVDFANTIACGGTLQTILQYYE